MLKRLAEARWIDYESGRGARLTGLGVAEARRVIRRHRLVELLLTRVLGLDWSEVDAEAEALEHAVSPRVEQALAAFLGEPLEDPHGHPIPTREGVLKQRRLRPLCDFHPGDHVVIREAQDDDPERLRRCARPRPDAGGSGSYRGPSAAGRPVSNRSRRPGFSDGPRRPGGVARRAAGVSRLVKAIISRLTPAARLRMRSVSLFVLTNHLVPLD